MRGIVCCYVEKFVYDWFLILVKLYIGFVRLMLICIKNKRYKKVVVICGFFEVVINYWIFSIVWFSELFILRVWELVWKLCWVIIILINLVVKLMLVCFSVDELILL